MRSDLSSYVVIFDLDGTLIDTALDLAAALNHALTASGRGTIDPATVRHLVGFGAKAMIRAGLKAQGEPAADDATVDALLEDFLTYYYAHIADHSRPFPGVVDAIDVLRGRGAKIAICTNKREGPARALIDTLELTQKFDAIVGGDTAGVAKPDPAPGKLCQTQTGRADAVFIGDSDTDIAAAAAIGAPCLLATFGYGPADRAADAYSAFDTYEEAIELIGRIWAENA